MLIEFQRAHGRWIRGQIIEVPDNDGWAKLLLRLGAVKAYEAPTRDKAVKRRKVRRKRGSDQHSKG